MKQHREETMKHNHHFKQNLIVLMVLTCLGVTSAWGVPQLINYQGMLNDTNGDPVAGLVNMTFKIYSIDTGGSFLWTEDHIAVQLDNGIYNVLLGSNTTLPISLFDSDHLWLEMIVNTEVFTPRTRFTSTAFNFRSDTADTVADADTLDGIDSTGFVQQNQTNSVTTGMINDGAVTNLKITGPISSSKIDSTGLNADTVDGLNGADLEESAEIDTDISTHAAIDDDHHTKTTNASELISGTLVDGRIPANITRDAELSAHEGNTSFHHTKTTSASEITSGTMNPSRISGIAWTGTNDGPGSGLDADRLDGMDSSDFLNTTATLSNSAFQSQ